MRETALIQFSPGRYYQGRGILQKIGEESALLGHKALIVVDDTVWKKTEERVRESLRSASVEFVRYAFRFLESLKVSGLKIIHSGSL